MLPTNVGKRYGMGRLLIFIIRLKVAHDNEVPIAPNTNEGKMDKVQGGRDNFFLFFRSIGDIDRAGGGVSG